jgi:hypothetical protein
MKKHSVKPTKKQLSLLKSYWKFLKDAENQFSKSVNIIEKDMSKKVGIQNLEFFQTDSGYVGIGNAERTMALIFDTELEK